MNAVAEVIGSEKISPTLECFLQKLDQIPWFQHVGQVLPYNHHVKQVFSWAEAWESLQDEDWIYASFHENVDTGHPAWVAAYDKAFAAVSRSGHNYELEDHIHVALQAASDAGGAAYEMAIKESSGFHLNLMKWYQAGRWPCGWQGTYPNGRLIVY